MAAATGVFKSGEIVDPQSSDSPKTASNETADAQVVKGEASEEWPSAVIAPKSNQHETTAKQKPKSKS